MPIYMDRHNVSDTVTAEHVAQLHQEDLKVQDQFGCRGLTYWFDEKRKIAFCLIEAPDIKNLEAMHNKAHGEIPHSIIEVDASIVESFLGRIEDPQKASDATLNIINDPAFRTIMVMVRKGVAGKIKTKIYDEALNKFNEAVPGILDIYSGSLVKHSENYSLVSFTTVSNAVRAAIDIHALFKHFTAAAGNDKIILKTGLTAGVPVTDKPSIFEDCIRTAERMCQVIPGEIIVAPEVKNIYNSENVKPLAGVKGIATINEADEKLIQQLMDYTEENYNNVNLKADDFCKPTGCSKSKLYRWLIALTGNSPNSFLKEYRLEAALKLLNKKAGNISEIAFETGFSSPSYFSKCFQRKYGLSPSDYIPD